MRTGPIVVAMLINAVAIIGVAEAQADQNAPAAVASQTAKKAWFVHAIDDILGAPVIEPAPRETTRQGRSVGRVERR